MPIIRYKLRVVFILKINRDYNPPPFNASTWVKKRFLLKIEWASGRSVKYQSLGM